MAQADQVFRGFLTCQQVVIVNVNGLVGILVGFSDKHIQKPFIIKIVNNWVLLPGVEDDKAVHLAGADKGLDDL